MFCSLSAAALIGCGSSDDIICRFTTRSGETTYSGFIRKINVSQETSEGTSCCFNKQYRKYILEHKQLRDKSLLLHVFQSD